ncbi:zinc finger BED domain-containing protein 5-like [Rhopalosiphum maidis]|uniref:zinc finger BED domain-containing protein 5-like n=1 Tax=Rhopalosiphum maidis TaxID=43146 RepID=UPI000EFEC7C0|nr:zinc finger BED domain-containing protein 5-like [Rhopalosiphum maidis]
MERWLKKGTLKRSSQEPEYFAVNSSHIDNHSNNENDTNEITPKYFKKCRKYDESYISLGFMNNNDNPQCVICSKVLPNSSMAPVKIINFIKSRPLQNRLFKILCEDMGSVHTSLLLHTEVRWLSRGKILTRIFELRDEVRAFFLEHNFELKDRFLDQMWLLKVAYLSDIFTKINELNFTLQSRHVNVFTAHEKIHAFKKKLDFWKICMSSNEFDCFPTIKCFSKEEEVEINEVFIEEIIQHLTGLSEGFNHYFPNDQQVKYKNELWIKNPFIVNTRPPAMSAKEYETFIEFTSDSSLQEKFKSMPLAEFWCSSKDEYPQLSQKAVLALLPFATTYMCETGFSTYVSTKTKYRNRLDAEPNMLLQLSSIKPNIKNILQNKKQFHASH